jgi:hypothetical protein
VDNRSNKLSNKVDDPDPQKQVLVPESDPEQNSSAPRLSSAPTNNPKISMSIQDGDAEGVIDTPVDDDSSPGQARSNEADPVPAANLSVERARSGRSVRKPRGAQVNGRAVEGDAEAPAETAADEILRTEKDHRGKKPEDPLRASGPSRTAALPESRLSISKGRKTKAQQSALPAKRAVDPIVEEEESEGRDGGEGSTATPGQTSSERSPRPTRAASKGKAVSVDIEGTSEKKASASRKEGEIRPDSEELKKTPARSAAGSKRTSAPAYDPVKDLPRSSHPTTARSKRTCELNALKIYDSH